MSLPHWETHETIWGPGWAGSQGEAGLWVLVGLFQAQGWRRAGKVKTAPAPPPEGSRVGASGVKAAPTWLCLNWSAANTERDRKWETRNGSSTEGGRKTGILIVAKIAALLFSSQREWEKESTATPFQSNNSLSLQQESFSYFRDLWCQCGRKLLSGQWVWPKLTNHNQTAYISLSRKSAIYLAGTGEKNLVSKENLGTVETTVWTCKNFTLIFHVQLCVTAAMFMC